MVTTSIFLFNEIKTTNFYLNNTWFNKRLSIPLYITVKGLRMGNKDTNEDLMNNQQYIKRIKGACSFLKLKTNKYLHFGRDTGSAMLELEGIHQDDINTLGN